MIKQARANGLAGHQKAGASGRRGLVTAVDPFRLAREVAEELCGVSDFAAGLGQRLTHLQCHQQRQIVDPLVHQFERAGEHVGPISWRGRRERGLGGNSRLQRGCPVCGRGISHRAQGSAGGGVDDLEGASVGGVDPFATDEQPLLDGFDDLDLILFAVLPAHSEPLS